MVCVEIVKSGKNAVLVQRVKVRVGGIDQRQRNKERCRDGMANGQNTTGAESRGNKPKSIYNERKVQLLQQNQASKLRVKGRS